MAEIAGEGGEGGDRQNTGVSNRQCWLITVTWMLNDQGDSNPHPLLWAVWHDSKPQVCGFPLYCKFMCSWSDMHSVFLSVPFGLVFPSLSVYSIFLSLPVRVFLSVFWSILAVVFFGLRSQSEPVCFVDIQAICPIYSVLMFYCDTVSFGQPAWKSRYYCSSVLSVCLSSCWY